MKKAVILVGGKQYLVEEKETLRVDLLPAGTKELELDALLVAEKDVKTCSNSGGINNPENSNQLIINGAVIASNLIANRTYGAATGANSMIPAEIINFDPSLYRWGKSEAQANEDDDTIEAELEEVYTREIAPRL